MTIEIGSKPDVMEVTLRDGSYVIDFQFTAEDTAVLVSALENAGFRWIEVGHGLGLNASDKGKRRAAASDEAHLEAAAEAAQSAHWGMFFIPGIGRKEDIDLAARYKMPFIRIGTNVTEVERARPFIERAKEQGLFTCYNAMKSYAVSPQEFAQTAKNAASWGADVVYIVDSAGTMLPEEIAAMIAAIQQETDVSIGFHGHDNLSMGMANTLQAIASGALLVDSSLRGMGRSAGNVITESLLAILHRKGLNKDLDLKLAMDISAGVIAPLVPGRGLDAMAITAGLAGFHSSFTAKVQSYAQQYDIDIRDLIVRLCERDQINAPDELLAELSEELALQQIPSLRSISTPGIRHEVSKSITLETLLNRLYSTAQKHQTQSVLNIVLSLTVEDQYSVSSNIYTTDVHTIGSVTISTEMQLVEVLNIVEAAVDIVFLDIDRRRIFGPQMAALTAGDILKKTRLLVYSDSRIWSVAVKDQVIRLLNEQAQGVRVVIAGDHPRSRLLALMLVDYGAEVTMIMRDKEEEEEYEIATAVFTQTDYPLDHFVGLEEATEHLNSAQVVVIWPSWGTWCDAEMAAHITAGTFLIDAGIGSIDPQGLDIALQNGVRPIRVNIWPTLSGALVAAHEGAQLQPQWGKIAGVPVVAGGALGALGTLIVDSLEFPTRIIGVADGLGGLLTSSDDYQEQVQKVTSAIHISKIQTR